MIINLAHFSIIYFHSEHTSHNNKSRPSTYHSNPSSSLLSAWLYKLLYKTYKTRSRCNTNVTTKPFANIFPFFDFSWSFIISYIYRPKHLIIIQLARPTTYYYKNTREKNIYCLPTCTKMFWWCPLFSIKVTAGEKY